MTGALDEAVGPLLPGTPGCPQRDLISPLSGVRAGPSFPKEERDREVRSAGEGEVGWDTE